MSRLAKKPIEIPEKTDVKVSGDSVVVKGPLGELSRTFKPLVSISVESGVITLTPKSTSKLSRSLWGTYASHLRNMVQGVNKAYEKKLIIEGVGFKAEVKGKEIVLNLGFSHPVTVSIPEGLTVSIEKNVMTVSGIDKELVGGFAAEVRSLKKPEPYKGKCIRYDGEIIKRKQGKRAVATA